MDQKQQIADRLKQANNILVTVSNNPTVDQLASCIGLTLALNKMGKHATAVFSGVVPSTIEFLQPEKTIENNVDSLRDFIISLDKNKADKLRYKVEDRVVKIFITPYHTSLSDKDLEFSQGDYNVDAVVALGVQVQADVDQAITAHGRILHDATVVTLNIKPGGELGSLNWTDPAASSLCELAAGLVSAMDKQALDAQIATALLTGIVAETDRFSNNKTSPNTMSISATLMAAGANQQLVVSKLAQAVPVASVMSAAPLAQGLAQGELQIRQSDSAASQPDGSVLSVGGGIAQSLEPSKPDETPAPVTNIEDLTGAGASGDKQEPELAHIHIDEQGGLHTLDDTPQDKPQGSTDPTIHMAGSRMILQPPSSLSGADGALGIPGPADVIEERPSGAPPPPLGSSPSPLSPPGPSPAPASTPSIPLMPPSMNPAPPAPPSPPVPPASAPYTPPVPPFGAVHGPAPAPSPVAGLTPPPGPPAGIPAPAHVDSARSAVAQALGAPSSTTAPSAPPDLGTSTPAGPPPPVPPPMIPTPQ